MDSRVAVAVQDQAAEHVAVRVPFPGLEVDEVAGLERAPPPGDELGRTGQPEPEPVAGRLEQAVEPLERGRRVLGRPDEALAVGGLEVPAHDHDPVALRAPDPLARGLGDPVEHGGLVAGRERERHPVARRLDLGDRPEAGRRKRRAIGAVTGGDLGIGRHDVDAVTAQVVGDRREGVTDGRAGACIRRRARLRLSRRDGPGPPGRDRATRRVGRSATEPRPGPDEDQRPRLTDGQEPWPPAARRPMGRPGA